MRIYFVRNFIIYLTSSPGLLILLNEKSSVAAREIYPLIAGVGIGMLFHAPFAALTNGMSSQDLSKTTSAFFLVRFIGATSGLVSSHSPVRLIYLIPLFFKSVAGAIFESRLSKTLPANLSLTVSASQDLRYLVQIEPISLRMEVLHDVSSAISVISVISM